MSGAAGPARGTAPRRPRRHHQHNDDEPSSDDSRDKEKRELGGHEEKRPKVNPIFLWALQSEQRIIEVRCEDYDKRNRIKLTKTAQGWRSIPRTASNVYTSLGVNGVADLQHHQVCESPAAAAPSSATSSPNSSRWSPATMISSSTVAPWSVSSTKSLLAVSSPAPDEEEEDEPPGRRDSSSTRSRIHSDESGNDFDDACIGNGSFLRLGKHSRKRRTRERNRASESEKRRRKMLVRVNNSREDRSAIKTWNDGLVVNERPVANNENVSEDESNGHSEGLEIVKRRESQTRRHEAKSRRRVRRRIDETAIERESQSRETSNRSVMSSPRSWELLMNGTRFLNSGPSIGIERGLVDEKDQEAEEEEYDQSRWFKGSLNKTNHFDSIDLERVKRDQHLQPRVVLEQLHLARSSEDGVGRPVGIVYEDDIEEEEEEIEETGVEGAKLLMEVNFKGKEDEETIRRKDAIAEKPEIGDILGMLDSTGSPVLATDTPVAHLPSPLDSTKTNISSCYETRDGQKAIRQRCRDKEKEKVEQRLLHNCYTKVVKQSEKITGAFSPCHFSETPNHQISSDQKTCFASGRCLVYSTRTEPDINISQMCDSPLNSIDRERIDRRENICDRVDSSSNELGTSSEILQALRSTPGLSISVTTRVAGCETRLESKRPCTALYVERLGPPQQAQHLGAPSPCCSSSEVTCSEDASNEITLEGIVAAPMRAAPPPPSSEKISGSGLAAVVTRLFNRRNDVRHVMDAGRQHRGNITHTSLRHELDNPDETPSAGKRDDSIDCQIAKSHSSRFPQQRPHPRTARTDGYRNPRRLTSRRNVEPANQLRELVENSGDAIPDPLLVPRDRLPALAAAPALEIPKLLASRPELRLPEALTRPDLLRDPDLLVISLAHLQHVLDHGEGPVPDYTYRPPHPLAMPLAEGDDEEDELEEEEEEDDDEDEDLDVPEQSLDLARSEASNGARVRAVGQDNTKTHRVPPKLISCKPIGSLMPGPIDLSRSCVRSLLPPRTSQPSSSISRLRQQDLPSSQLPPPPLLKVRTGLLKQESEVTSTEISPPCVPDDSHLWHPLFGSQKIQRQQQQEQPPQSQQEKQQQQHRTTSWHRTTLAS